MKKFWFRRHFLNVMLASTILLAFLTFYTPKIKASPDALPRLEVSGNKIQYLNGTEVWLKGVDIPYQIWCPTRQNKMNLQQFEYMNQWGINVVRIVINRKSWVLWDNEAQNLARLDDMIDWTEAKGIYAVISYHWGPVDVTSSSWEGWNAWETFWSMLATRYNGETHVMYDLMNEAINLEPSFHQTVMRDMIDTIRAIDPNDPIIVIEAFSYVGWYDIALNFEKTYPISRSNIIFSPHAFYWNENNPTSKTSIQNKIENRGYKWCHENNRVVWVGECNWDMRFTGEGDTNGKEWFRNFLEVIDEDGYNGFASWGWQTTSEHDKYFLLADWNGNPSDMGTILQDFLPDAPEYPPTTEETVIITSYSTVYLVTQTDEHVSLPNVEINGTYYTDEKGIKSFNLTIPETYIFTVQTPTEYYPTWVLGADSFNYNGSHYIAESYITENYTYFQFYFSSSDQPYVNSADTKLTSLTLTSSSFSILANGTGSKTINVSVGDRGKPDEILGASWTFDSPILSLDVTFSSSQQIIVYWDDVLTVLTYPSESIIRGDGFNLFFYPNEALNIAGDNTLKIEVQSGLWNGTSGYLLAYADSGQLRFTAQNTSTLQVSSPDATQGFTLSVSGAIKSTAGANLYNVAFESDANVIIYWTFVFKPLFPLMFILGMFGIVGVVGGSMYLMNEIKRKSHAEYKTIVNGIIIVTLGIVFVIAWLWD